MPKPAGNYKQPAGVYRLPDATPRELQERRADLKARHERAPRCPCETKAHTHCKLHTIKHLQGCRFHNPGLPLQQHPLQMQGILGGPAAPRAQPAKAAAPPAPAPKKAAAKAPAPPAPRPPQPKAAAPAPPAPATKKAANKDMAELETARREATNMYDRLKNRQNEMEAHSAKYNIHPNPGESQAQYKARMAEREAEIKQRAKAKQAAHNHVPADRNLANAELERLVFPQGLRGYHHAYRDEKIANSTLLNKKEKERLTLYLMRKLDNLGAYQKQPRNPWGT